MPSGRSDVHPRVATIDALAVLWAQYALETGRGKSCFNGNLGNIKRVDGDGRDWMWLQTFEFINGNRIARFFEPCGNSSFGNGFAQGGHTNFGGHGFILSR